MIAFAEEFWKKVWSLIKTLLEWGSSMGVDWCVVGWMWVNSSPTAYKWDTAKPDSPE